MKEITDSLQTFKTFKQVKDLYKIEKWWHQPWHFSQSGQYTCLLEGNKECYKGDNEYIIGNRR